MGWSRYNARNQTSSIDPPGPGDRFSLTYEAWAREWVPLRIERGAALAPPSHPNRLNGRVTL